MNRWEAFTDDELERIEGALEDAKEWVLWGEVSDEVVRRSGAPREQWS